MKNRLIITTILAAFILSLQGCSNPKPAANEDKMEWWRDARFGMFIHWGPYAIWGGVYHGHRQKKIGAEWIMNACKIPVAEYQQVAATFNPVKFDADRWVKLAKDAGMKYVVMTSKHHDGFAMFKSDASDFNIVDFTPYGKDVIEELAKACRKYDMKLGLYYSQAQDWNNPGGAVSRRTMNYGWDNPDSTKIDAYTAAHGGHWDPAQTSRTMEEYMNKVSIPQVREILTKYGEISVLWWDTPTDMTAQFADALLAEVNKLQPGIILNDRLKKPDYTGDFSTVEQKITEEGKTDRDWESCMTLNGSWGFKSWDEEWKSPETIVRNLFDVVSRGGNYLVNIGPDAEGVIPTQSIETLETVGKWVSVNGQAIYGSKQSPLEEPQWGRITMKEVKGKTVLHLSVFEWPADNKLVVKGVKAAKKAVLLEGAQKLESAVVDGDAVIYLPAERPETLLPVIKLEVKL